MKKEIVPVKLKAYNKRSVLLDMINAIYDDSNYTSTSSPDHIMERRNIVDTTYEEVKPEQLSNGKQE